MYALYNAPAMCAKKINCMKKDRDSINFKKLPVFITEHRL
jgi:hypothetical protein